MQQNNAQIFLTTRFGDVAVGGWFKECAEGAWHIKNSRCSGQYRSNGVDGEPMFDDDEPVLICGNNGA